MRPTRIASDVRGGFRDDDRGAIMVIGVFLSCLILAGMWYVIGLGDAIIWRDRSQEAADAIAYTSASVHARGMNLIAFINLLMVVITTIYLILALGRAIIDVGLFITGDPSPAPCIPTTNDTTYGHSVLNLSAYLGEMITDFDHGPRYDGMKGPPITGALEEAGYYLSYFPDNAGGRDLARCFKLLPACATVIGCVAFIACCAKATFNDKAKKLAKVYVPLDETIIPKYRSFMKFTLPKMSEVEFWTARLAPGLGAVAGSVVGYQYSERTSGSDATQLARHWGTAISPSMMGAKSGDEARCTRLRTDLEYIPYQGNKYGPTLCNDGKVSNSGQPPGGKTRCTTDSPGCICYKHGGVAADQSKLYEDAPCDNVPDDKDQRVGLPVEGKKMNELCVKSFQFIGELVEEIFSAIKGAVMGTTGNLKSVKGRSKDTSDPGAQGDETKGEGKTAGDIFDKFMDWVGDKFKGWYCTGGTNDVGIEVGAGHASKHGAPGGYEPKLTDKDFWEKKEKRTSGTPFIGGGDQVDHYIGPHHVVSYAANGNDWMQVYGFVVDVNKPEFAFDRVALGQGPKEWSSQTDSYSGAGFYVAEAEFYHDCAEKWTGETCNERDVAAYRMSWRTRMRRVHRPKWLTELTSKVPLQGVVNYMISNNQAIVELAQRYAGTDINTAMGLLQNFAGGGRIPPNMVH